MYWLKEGNSRMVSLEVKDVISAALRGGTESVVLCHNHPNGVPLPSREDLAATENIVRALGLVKIRPVSYTHLDVYKRQALHHPLEVRWGA